MSLASVPAADAADPATKVVPSARALEASPTPTTVLVRLVCVRMLPLPCSPRGGSLEPSRNVGAVSANRLGAACRSHGRHLGRRSARGCDTGAHGRLHDPG